MRWVSSDVTYQPSSIANLCPAFKAQRTSNAHSISTRPLGFDGFYGCCAALAGLLRERGSEVPPFVMLLDAGAELSYFTTGIAIDLSAQHLKHG